MKYKTNNYYTVNLDNHPSWDGEAICRLEYIYDQSNTTKKLNMLPIKIISKSRKNYRELRIGFSIKIWEEDIAVIKIENLNINEYPEYYL